MLLFVKLRFWKQIATASKQNYLGTGYYKYFFLLYDQNIFPPYPPCSVSLGVSWERAGMGWSPPPILITETVSRALSADPTPRNTGSQCQR